MDIDVKAAQREAAAAPEAFIASQSLASASCQVRQAVLKARIDAMEKYFDGLVTSPTGFMSGFHAKTQTACRAMDELSNDSIDQGLMDASYQDEQHRSVLSASNPTLRQIREQS